MNKADKTTLVSIMVMTTVLFFFQQYEGGGGIDGSTYIQAQLSPLLFILTLMLFFNIPGKLLLEKIAINNANKSKNTNYKPSYKSIPIMAALMVSTASSYVYFDYFHYDVASSRKFVESYMGDIKPLSPALPEEEFENDMREFHASPEANPHLLEKYQLEGHLIATFVLVSTLQKSEHYKEEKQKQDDLKRHLTVGLKHCKKESLYSYLSMIYDDFDYLYTEDELAEIKAKKVEIEQNPESIEYHIIRLSNSFINTMLFT